MGNDVAEARTPTRREQIANELVALAALEDLIRQRKGELKAEGEAEFARPGTREMAELNGRVIGAVNMVKGSSSWSVYNSSEFLRWVKANHPTEVVESVRESFTAAVIAKLRKGGAEVDPDTGELICPAGVAPIYGQPYLRVTKTEDAIPTVLNLLGEIAVPFGLAVAAELEA